MSERDDHMELWDQKLARMLVRPFVPTALRPNHITWATLILAVAAGVLFALGGSAVHLAAGLFVLARFLDHWDGELARLQGTHSEFGARLDYVAGGLSYGALFLGLCIAEVSGPLGLWALVLAASAVAGGVLNTILRMRLQRQGRSDLPDYPARHGFDMEDGIYLLAPITWAGLLDFFFVAACLGATVYGLWTIALYRREKGRPRPA